MIDIGQEYPQKALPAGKSAAYDRRALAGRHRIDEQRLRFHAGRTAPRQNVSQPAAGKETDNLQPGTLAFKGGGMRNDFR